MSSAAASSAPRRPSDPGDARRDALVLGAGALGLAWALTTTAAYLPPILGRYTDSETLVGLVLAAEGAFALTLPLVIGPWSDTFHTPLGRRRPFMLVALPPMAFALALLAFMPNLWTTALLLSRSSSRTTSTSRRTAGSTRTSSRASSSAGRREFSTCFVGWRSAAA